MVPLRLAERRFVLSLTMKEKTYDTTKAALMMGALGVVYGDIGTSPLYALRECFAETHGVAPTPDNVLGILSLIIWTLVIVVCVKYLGFVLRADNRGEGGILALLSLAFGEILSQPRRRFSLISLGLFGAALLYGDGIITPCITVLGAIEGLEVATPFFKPYVVPIAIVVIILLFAFQKFGTARVGKVFGPITLLWFITIAVLGVRGIIREPGVLMALNPYYGLHFLAEDGLHALVVLGAVFLVATGSEALYADLGHFGAGPIRRAWFTIVFPSLILNYLGQGALVLTDPDAVHNPFFRLAPEWALYPLVGLATVASVIASQALISGAYSVTMQAVQLGYLPRLRILHTSAQEKGQIYIPFVNWLLMLCCIGLVLGFKTSSNISAAYGIAVSMTTLITTVLFYFAARRVWQWSAFTAGALCAVFLIVETTFFMANCLKIPHGGWFSLVVAGMIFTVMTTWKSGRRLLGERLSASMLPFELFLGSIKNLNPHRVKGTAVYMSGNPTGTPLALLHNLKHNQVLHERVVLLTIQTIEQPHVSGDKRVEVEKMPENFYRVVGRFGFMDRPNIASVLRACRRQGLDIDINESSYFLTRETIISTARPGMAAWRERLFSFLARNAQPATAFFGLPANRVIELGMQVEF